MATLLPRFALLVLLAIPTSAFARHACADAAIEQARKLLAFHFGEGENVSIGEEVKVLPPLRNPANTRQQFDVLEVWGSIYKGRYRMRMIYARIPDTCALVGQEILEHATL